MTRSPGIAGLNDKLQDAAPHARITLAALVELLGRDEQLRRELYAAVERSAGFMFWPRLIPRPLLVAQDSPRIAPGASHPAPRPSAHTAPERVPQSTPDSSLARYPVQPAPVVPVHPAPTPVPASPAQPARRGALPRRAAAPAGDGMGELQALVAQRLGGAP